MSDHQPQGIMVPIYPIFGTKQGLPEDQPGHITGRPHDPPPPSKGISIWPWR